MNRKAGIKLTVGAIIIGIILTISTMVSAYSVGMSLSSSSKLNAGDTVVVSVNLGAIDAGNGIDTITAELNYDTAVFETLATSNFTASNSWTPTFAASSNMLSLLKNTKVTAGETVLTINLKVKSSISVDSTKITLQDIVVSGGRVADGGTGDINVNSTSVTISKAASPVTNTTNTTVKDNTVSAKKTLPKTGIEQYGIIAIVVIAIVGIFSYVLYKKTSKVV